MEGIVERLPNGFGVAVVDGMFDLNENGGFGGRMAKREIGAALTGLILRPYDGWIPPVPA